MICRGFSVLGLDSGRVRFEVLVVLWNRGEMLRWVCLVVVVVVDGGVRGFVDRFDESSGENDLCTWGIGVCG